jgi:hypothetical protein
MELTNPAGLDHAPDGGCPCVRCGTWNALAARACRNCLAPLNEAGVVQGLDRPLRLPGWWGPTAGGGFLAAALALLSFLPNTPLHALRLRLFGPPAPPVRVVAVPAPRPPGLGKFEPETGCFIGAYILQDVNISGKVERWEQLTGKGHASYLRYVGYGRPFPKEWVAGVRRHGAVPCLALEPNDGLGMVQDCGKSCRHGEATLADGRPAPPPERVCLRRFARDAAESGGPVFLRFASEMNGPWTRYHGNPRKYREKFRLVARVMHEEAPNVAMVWTPYCTPRRVIPDYYPGDDAVDWVGVNIYSVHHHDGLLHRPAHWQDPADLLDPIYRLYADRKPIQISEYAATHTCKACGKYTADFAMDKMIRMYRCLPRDYPRVKMIFWFSYDTISGKAAENNYAVTDDPVITDTYRRLVAPDYFLPRMPEGEYWTRAAKGDS